VGADIVEADEVGLLLVYHAVSVEPRRIGAACSRVLENLFLDLIDEVRAEQLERLKVEDVVREGIFVVFEAFPLAGVLVAKHLVVVHEEEDFVELLTFHLVSASIHNDLEVLLFDFTNLNILIKKHILKHLAVLFKEFLHYRGHVLARRSEFLIGVWSLLDLHHRLPLGDQSHIIHRLFREMAAHHRTGTKFEMLKL